ncbi:putative transcription factor ovo-like protein 3 [Hypanus sabinus]|uniref:putative transcription factor ovo-like protein 3 n=1 Tax=Hypanus sabinus TaxID=79690 RepID=UPI0028C5072D|nr:putative transcription factor ovo-like protein 3 [Hypanus sabinus]
MPRSFLIKKRECGIRSWGHVSDDQRGDFYVPGCSYGQAMQPLSEQNAAINPEVRSHDLHAKLLEGSFQGEPHLDGQSLSGKAKMKPAGGQGHFVCFCCWKVFSLQRMLTRHLKSHSAVKRHVCRFCGKGFNDTFDLKRHLRTHTGIRPYKCDRCEKAFTQRCSLESHLKKIHNVHQNYAYRERRSKIFVCEECGFTAAQGDTYFLHLRDYHPMNPALCRFLRKRTPAQNRIRMLLFPHYL